MNFWGIMADQQNLLLRSKVTGWYSENRWVVEDGG